MYTDYRDKGLFLLKKGQKGIIHAVFSRFGLIVLLLLIQILIMVGIFRWLGEFLPHIWGGAVLFIVIMLLYLLNSGMDPSAKITWLIVIMLMPVFGVLLFLYTQSDIGHRALKARMNRIIAETKNDIPQSEAVFRRFAGENKGAASLARYMARSGCHPVYDKTAVRYFPLGEDMFGEMLKQLAAAEHFIFMEYFIRSEERRVGKECRL